MKHEREKKSENFPINAIDTENQQAIKIRSKIYTTFLMNDTQTKID